MLMSSTVTPRSEAMAGMTGKKIFPLCAEQDVRQRSESHDGEQIFRT